MTAHELASAECGSFFESYANHFQGCSLKQAHLEWDWSLMDLVREIEYIQAKKNLPISSLENIRLQIIGCEKRNFTGPLWRELFAAALWKSPEDLFGVGVLIKLPFSDICAAPTVPEFLHMFHAKLDTIVRLEHIFGARSVKARLENDLSFLKHCFPTLPCILHNDFVLLVARVSKLLGWVVQESGLNQTNYWAQYTANL